MNEQIGRPEVCGVKITGTPSAEELRISGGFPREERWKRGPVAFIECVEKIPCNPCEAACPYGAISVGADITSLPLLNGDACIGCGLCIAVCPGLAIYVKDFAFESERASISFPYEYVPLPKKGQHVLMTNRDGEVVCDGEVLTVTTSKRNDRTAVIRAVFDRQFFLEVVSMQRLEAHSVGIDTITNRGGNE